jgi:hypothetical protein
LINENSDSPEVRQTLGFQRVIQRAVFHVQSTGKREVTGANVLVAIFGEKESHAVFLLRKQGVSRGDIVNYNAAVSYRLLGSVGEDACDHEGHTHSHVKSPKGAVAPHDHRDQAATTWDLILEANGDWRDRVSIGGIEEENTGGNVIFLSAGSRLTLPNGWTTSVSVGVPAVSDLNGIQSEPALRMLFGISKGF